MYHTIRTINRIAEDPVPILNRIRSQVQRAYDCMSDGQPALLPDCHENLHAHMEERLEECAALAWVMGLDDNATLNALLDVARYDTPPSSAVFIRA